MDQVMEIIVPVLDRSALAPVWSWGVRLSAFYLALVSLAGAFLPSAAKMFFGGFAQGIVSNSVEGILRAAAGLSFMGLSPMSRVPEASFGTGAVLFVTAVAILVLPGLHARFGKWAVPFAQKWVRAIAAGSLPLAAGVVWLHPALFFGQ